MLCSHLIELRSGKENKFHIPIAKGMFCTIDGYFSPKETGKHYFCIIIDFMIFGGSRSLLITLHSI